MEHCCKKKHYGSEITKRQTLLVVANDKKSEQNNGPIRRRDKMQNRNITKSKQKRTNHSTDRNKTTQKHEATTNKPSTFTAKQQQHEQTTHTTHAYRSASVFQWRWLGLSGAAHLIRVGQPHVSCTQQNTQASHKKVKKRVAA